MSFAGNVKAEICRVTSFKKCCALAQCFGVLLFCNSFSREGIRIITESREFGQVLPKLFHKAFGVEFDSYPSMASPGKLHFLVEDPLKIRRIFDAFGYDWDTLALHVNLAVVEEECCKAAFVRGAFLSGGSVTDPEKGYHLEIGTSHQAVLRQTDALMEEVLGFYPKIAARGGSQVLYLKQSDQIFDCLTYLGAPVCAMEILEAKLEKELNNKVNRRCNCDDANLSKVVEAAQEQLAAIRILRERGILEKLPPKLRAAALAREAEPEASLSELAARMDPPITKPAMNNRMKKLVQFAKEVAP